ncbi:serine palmitoyltransferase small subunit A [Pelobates cultripes]|uniref:Serine palmitoyltransferase small subunit A n=1 Tax=Pelobates cultripes TaxID=61616 RepID=A0AAD1TMY2_PELCU|nr:serine palmitoyltransferase small subunit A [Pelobates cultripes]
MKASCEAESGAWGSLGRAWKHMSWLYYQYLLVTALYMLEPWERTIFNSMLISIMGMALYTGYIFMPQHILAILHYFEIVQ